MVARFTKEQLTILAHIQNNRWALIPGCTGSGKTLLAMETARRLQGAGQKVLVLCYSPFLAKDMRHQLHGSDIRISDFNTFVHTILQNPDQPEMAAIPTLGRTQGLRPKYDRPWTQFDVPSDYELNVALSRMLHSPQRFDAVIVDEGHEFKPESTVSACNPARSLGHNATPRWRWRRSFYPATAAMAEISLI
jgi:superfamily II DNA or RNA helicase